MSSKWRKHVTQQAVHVESPCEGQQIVQAVGSRGSNLVEVRRPVHDAWWHDAWCLEGFMLTHRRFADLCGCTATDLRRHDV